MRQALVLAAVLALVAMGCGSGSGTVSIGFLPGPPVLFLPFIPVGAGGSVETVVLTNLAEVDAPASVRAFDGIGLPYAAGPTDVLVPARGHLSLPLSALLLGTTPDGGWVEVDSRVAGAIVGERVAVPTTGFVAALMDRQSGGASPMADAVPGLAFRSANVRAGVLPATGEVQIVNNSILPGAPPTPSPLGVTVSFFDPFGDLVSTLSVLLGPHGTAVLVPGLFGVPGFAAGGQITVEPDFAASPVGVVPAYGIAARERSFFTHTEGRFLLESDARIPGQAELGFAVEWGVDAPGNRYDFGLLATNATSGELTLTIVAIYREVGAALLTVPRAVTVGAHETVFLATTNTNSLGLEFGEVSPFADIFGDPLATSAFESVTLLVQVPRELDVSARAFDPAFNSFYKVHRGIRRTSVPAVLHVPVEPFLGSGRLNEVHLTNPTADPMDVPYRVRTPGGTEYLLGPVTLPPLARLDLSLDGTIFLEDPNDPLGAPVPSVTLLLGPPGGILVEARSTQVNALGLIQILQPRLVLEGD